MGSKNFILILITTFLVSACMQQGGGSRYRAGSGGSLSGSGSSKTSKGGSTSGGTLAQKLEAQRRAEQAEQAKCDRIADIVERVQWNCHSMFTGENAALISSGCMSSWQRLYKSPYCDIRYPNATIKACAADLQKYWSAVSTGCKSALQPFTKK